MSDNTGPLMTNLTNQRWLKGEDFENANETTVLTLEGDESESKRAKKLNRKQEKFRETKTKANEKETRPRSSDRKNPGTKYPSTASKRKPQNSAEGRQDIVSGQIGVERDMVEQSLGSRIWPTQWRQDHQLLIVSYMPIFLGLAVAITFLRLKRYYPFKILCPR